MKKRISLIVLSIALIVSLGSCNQDSKTLLTDGSWIFSNITADSESDTIAAFVTLANFGYEAATLSFNEDKTFVIDGPRLLDVYTGTWSMVGEIKLIMNYDDREVPSTVNIDLLSDSELEYSETLPEPDMDLSFFKLTTKWTR